MPICIQRVLNTFTRDAKITKSTKLFHSASKITCC